MGDLMYLKTYAGFRRASERAKSLAVLQKVEEAVCRADGNRDVKAPEAVVYWLKSSMVREQETECDDERDHYHEDMLAQHNEEIYEEQMEELERHREHWARSDEAGWFYNE